MCRWHIMFLVLWIESNLQRTIVIKPKKQSHEN